MTLTDFHVQGYRSVRDIWLKLHPVNVIIGANGSGKSNLYRAIYLVHCAAAGQLSAALSEEGGISSALWAGPINKRDKYPRKIALSLRIHEFEYNLVLGMCGETSRPPTFIADPEVKFEEVLHLNKGVKHKLLERHRASIILRNVDGEKIDYSTRVPDNESVLSALRDPVSFPYLYKLRDEILRWRFYQHFRTDFDSPVRLPHVGYMTPCLADDGHNLASALATISECGRADELDQAIIEAFPGSKLLISSSRSMFRLAMSFSDSDRYFDARELSDGTLQYLCLLAALLSRDPAPLIALNEPETSLHPRLMEPLARLLVNASSDSQLWITTHSRELADAILDMSGYDQLELKKEKGETKLVGVGLGGYKFKEEEEEEPESGS